MSLPVSRSVSLLRLSLDVMTVFVDSGRMSGETKCYYIPPLSPRGGPTPTLLRPPASRASLEKMTRITSRKQKALLGGCGGGGAGQLRINLRVEISVCVCVRAEELHMKLCRLSILSRDCDADALGG